MPVRVLDYEGKGDVATIARGIRLAARKGAKVINMSFEFDIGLTAPQIPDVLSAVRYAHRQGAVLVAAAGNTEETRVAYPARAKHVIAVGATTEHGCVADYSNTGPGLTLVAPGGGADAFVDARSELQAARGPGPRRVPVHLPRHEPPPLRPAERLRGHLHGRAARERHGGAADRLTGAR